MLETAKNFITVFFEELRRTLVSFVAGFKEKVTSLIGGERPQPSSNNSEPSPAIVLKDVDEKVPDIILQKPTPTIEEGPPLAASAFANLADSGLAVSGGVDKPTIIQRTVERVVFGITAEELDQRLGEQEKKFFAKIEGLKNQIASMGSQNFQAIALTNKIDRLSNITVSGVTGLTDADIPNNITVSGYLPLTGGALTGALTGTNLTLSGDLTVSGAQIFSGALTASYFSATSTTNASIIDYRLGIGTTSPYAMLSVAGQTVAEYFTATSTTATSYFAGNLGVASSSPAALFSVAGSAYIGTSTDSTLTIHAGRINYPVHSTSTIASLVNGFSIATSTLAYPIMSFDGLNGRIGLATSSPFGFLSLDAFQATTTPTLYVKGGPNQTANLFTFANTSSTLFGLNSDGSLSLVNASSTSSILTINASSTNPLVDLAQTGSGYLLRIATSTSSLTPKALVLDNKGFFGIGTSTPEEHFDLWVNNSGNARFTIASSTAEISVIASTARNALRVVQKSTGALLELLDNTASRLKIYLAGNIDSDYLVATYNLKVEMQDAATVRVPVPSSAQKDAVVLNINGKIRKITATTTASLTADLDTGTEAPGVDYYVYAVADDSTASIFSLKLSASKIAPTGLANYRLIGGLHNNASSNIATTSVYTLKDPKDQTYEGMVKVGNFWIDIYEASVWTGVDGVGTQVGQSSDNYDASCGGSDTGNNFGCYAASKYNVTPSRNITWFQAAQACVLSGKRLPVDAEWSAAAAGTTDPGATGTAPNCNVSGSAPSTTGTGTNCVSSYGVENMIGSLWEWTADWYVAGTNYTNSGADGTSYTTWPAGYGSDTTYNIGGRAYDGAAYQNGLPAASIRGGGWGDGASSGMFAMVLIYAPSSIDTSFGFRCAR